MEELAPLAVAAPFLVAAALAISLPLSRRRDDLVGVIVASGVTVFCGFLLLQTIRDPTPVVTWLGGWEPQDGVALGITMAFDEFGAGLSVLAALLVTASFVFGWKYFDAKGPIFHALMLVFLGAMAGFALSGDLFNLFVFFELMSVSAYALTAYKIEESGPLQGALTFAISNSVGAVMILFGIGLLYGRTGALNLAQVGEALASQPADGLVLVSFALIVGGFMVKAAIVPFHFWLADAYATAPTPACIVFSGVMSDLGLYALARIYWTVYDGTLDEHVDTIRAVLVGMGTVTALWGAGMCLVQYHLKRLLAFVTMSQIGVGLIAVGLLTGDGMAAASMLVLCDGLLRAGLFVAVGCVLHRTGSINEFRLRRMGRELPWPVIAAFVVGAIGLAAPPFLGAFTGKRLLEHAAEEVGYAWVVIPVLLATIMAAAALLRAAGRVFLGMGPTGSLDPAAEVEDDETTGARGTTPIPMIATAVVLVVLGLLVGIAPGVGDRAQETGARFVDREAYVSAVLDDRPQLSPAAELTPIAPLDIGLALLSIGGAFLLAFAQLRPQGRRPLERPGGRVIAQGLFALRRLHTGQVGDYVAWMTVGFAVFGGLLILAIL